MRNGVRNIHMEKVIALIELTSTLQFCNWQNQDLIIFFSNSANYGPLPCRARQRYTSRLDICTHYRRNLD